MSNKTINKIHSIIFRASTFYEIGSIKALINQLPYCVMKGEDIGGEHDRLIVNLYGNVLGQNHNNFKTEDLIHVDDLDLELGLSEPDKDGNLFLWSVSNAPHANLSSMKNYINRIAKMTKASQATVRGNRGLPNVGVVAPQAA